ncbi:MAG: hemerythrin family protein [Synergistaceae bacterium]|nr:hemerythrin family protein [Synergistaceae bacterium]
MKWTFNGRTNTLWELESSTTSIKKLIERTASFSRAVESEDTHCIGDTVNYLLGYTIQHFGAEELIMIRNRYDRFKEHRDEHSWFIKEVYDVYCPMADPESFSPQELTDLRDFLVRWVFDHIMHKDRDIARCLPPHQEPLFRDRPQQRYGHRHERRPVN